MRCPREEEDQMQLAKFQIYYAFSGVVMHCLLTGRETNHSFCLFENRSSGNSQTPVHLHELEDETLYVLEGEMQAILDGKVHVVREGEAVFLPRGTPHQLRNASEAPSRYSILCIPSGFEDFVAEAGHVMAEGEAATPPTSLEIQSMKEAAPRFGIRLLPGFPKHP
jgi:quercetin dioxygenase-like cupin family protein